MSRAIIKNDWCITTSEDWRETFIVGDPDLPFVENPAFDPDQPDTNRNPSLIPQPLDLTGYDVRMDIREGDSVTDPAIIELETGSEITLGSPNPTDGTVELFIDNLVTKTSAFTSRVGKDNFFDLFITPPAGDNVKLFAGVISFIGGITDV